MQSPHSGFPATTFDLDGGHGWVGEARRNSLRQEVAAADVALLASEPTEVRSGRWTCPPNVPDSGSCCQWDSQHGRQKGSLAKS